MSDIIPPNPPEGINDRDDSPTHFFLPGVEELICGATSVVSLVDGRYVLTQSQLETQQAPIPPKRVWQVQHSTQLDAGLEWYVIDGGVGGRFGSH